MVFFNWGVKIRYVDGREGLYNHSGKISDSRIVTYASREQARTSARTLKHWRMGGIGIVSAVPVKLATTVIG